MASTKLNVTEDPKAHLVRLVKDFDTAMLISQNASDQLRGRPMRIARADVEQNLWFMATMESTKIEELTRDPRVCITMQKNGEYVSLSGNVHISNDKGSIEELWQESYRPWFPQGKDTADLILLKVDTTWGEFWDSQSGKRTTLDFVKQMIGSGDKQTSTTEDHAKVSLTSPTRT